MIEQCRNSYERYCVVLSKQGAVESVLAGGAVKYCREADVGRFLLYPHVQRVRMKFSV